MATSYFPCRVCGQLTVGDDSYVVCAACAAEYEQRAGHRLGEEGLSPQFPLAGQMQLPLAASEVEARLRKLLDDW
jgi:hypothetical protein